MKKYTVFIALAETVEANNEDEAWDKAYSLIEHRDGMEIIKHEIIEVEDKT